MAATTKPKKPDNMVKGGWFYREDDKGKMLRVRRAEGKKKKEAPPAPKPLADRVKTDPALLRRVLADPGLRSKLPEKYLSTKQRAGRRDREFRSDLGDITSPLTGDSLVRTGETLVDREYRPQLRDIERDEGRVEAQRNAQQRWAAQYGKNLQSQFGATTGAQASANTAAQEDAERRRVELIGGLGKIGEDAAARAQADEAIRGQGLSVNQPAEQALAVAKARGEQQGAGQVADTARTGGVQEAFLRQLAGVQTLRSQEADGEIRTRAANRLGELGTERKNLRKDRDGKLTEVLTKLRGQEREGYLTEQGIVGDLQQARIEARTKAAQFKSQEARDRAQMAHEVTLKQMGIDADDARLMAQQDFDRGENALNRQTQLEVAGAKDKDKVAGFSLKERKQFASQRNTAIDLAGSLYGDKFPRQRALAAIVDKVGDGLLAKIAVTIQYDLNSRDKNVKKAARRTLAGYSKQLKQQYGITLPSKYLRG